MLPIRLLALLAVALCVGSATAAPITVTNGESFLLAYGEGSNTYQFKSTYGPLGTFTPGTFNLAADSSSVNFFGDGGSASAAFSHTSSGTGLSITGSTAASSLAGGKYVGQGAPDSDGVVSTDFTFGYYLEFTLAALTSLKLQVDGTTTDSGNGAYADFGAIVFDSGNNPLYKLGGTTSGSSSLTFTLGPGTYYFFTQSQSSVNGNGAASAGASFTATLEVVAETPEPLSVVAFGGLLAAGGLAAWRRKTVG